MNRNNIDIFPVSVPYKPGARILSEQNLINFLKSSTDNPSYVISSNIEDSENSFEFVIDGHYCKISKLQTILDSFTIKKGDVYVIITYNDIKDSFNDPKEGYSYQYLDIEVDEETGNISNGITFDITDPGSPLNLKDFVNSKSLKLFEISETEILEGGQVIAKTFVIPSTSKERFRPQSFSLDEIDGGEIS